jgi:hypothetical protein
MTVCSPRQSKKTWLKSIRRECYTRYDAVQLEALGVYGTYCGLSRRPAGVFDKATAPAGCQLCRARLRCSLLVLHSLKALHNEAVNGLPGPDR